MYFGNYKMSKTCLDYSLKSAVSEDPLTLNMLKGPNNCEIFMRALLSYFSTTVRRNNLENISAFEV